MIFTLRENLKSRFISTNKLKSDYPCDLKVRDPFVQTLCIEEDSYMDAI